MAELFASSSFHWHGFTASPLGRQWPSDLSLGHNILWGEYADVLLLFPDSLAHPQAPSPKFWLKYCTCPQAPRVPL